MIEYRTVNSVASAPTQDAIEKYAPYRNTVNAFISSRWVPGSGIEYTNEVTVQAGSTLYNATGLEALLKHPSESFSQALLRLAEDRGYSQVDLYKNAGIDRKVFSRIRNDIGYRPSKSTVVSFALALELSLDETLDLMSRAGYALSPSNRGDLILRFFIENQVYDPAIINAALFEHGLPTLFFGTT